MKPVWVAFLGISAIAVSALLVFNIVPSEYVVRISEQQASEKMQETIEKKAAEGLLIEDPVLTFNHNALQFSGRVTGEKFKQQFYAEVYVEGTPYYDTSQYAVYFTPTTFTLRNFSFRGETPADKARRIAGSTFKNTQVGQVLENSAESIERWVASAAEGRVRSMLSKRPVYKIKDDLKGITIKATLSSVSIEDKHLVAKLSVLQLGKSALIVAVSALVCIVLFFMGFVL